MTKLPIIKDGVAVEPQSAAILLLIIIADTTWRMFVPTIGGTFVGIGLDHAFNSTPLYTTVMIIIGSLVSLTLVYFQYRGVKKK